MIFELDLRLMMELGSAQLTSIQDWLIRTDFRNCNGKTITEDTFQFIQ